MPLRGNRIVGDRRRSGGADGSGVPLLRKWARRVVEFGSESFSRRLGRNPWRGVDFGIRCWR